MDTELLMPFIGDNDCEAYVRGFAGGRLWEILKKNDAEQFPFTFLTADTKQIEMILQRFSRKYNIIELDKNYSSIENVVILN